MSEYIEKFSNLVHQLLAQDPTIASSVITKHFVDGLKNKIGIVVMIHRPDELELDTAGSLALL